MFIRKTTVVADVCIIVEGSYPYVAGGVSSWIHELIESQPHLQFHLLILLAQSSDRELKYTLPENVVGTTEIVLQSLPQGKKRLPNSALIAQQIELTLNNLMHNGGFEDLKNLLEVLSKYKGKLGQEFLINSPEAWQMLLRMYNREFSHCSFLDYFWTWRGLLGGMYSVLQGELPEAKVYHSVSTGYAGLYLTRAKIETGRPAILTEHGIYTNERHIEIAMADWLHEEDHSLQGMAVDSSKRNIRHLWMQSFQSYSRACYSACDRIITLFGGNQKFQLHDGAQRSLMEIIPNGVDYERYEILQNEQRGNNFVVALIGRVVPIKDIKTYITAISRVKETIPEIRAYVLGPIDEDPEYYCECMQLADHLGVQKELNFAGRVDLTQWMERIDINVLTSISEGQPLVILEAGAAGIPTIATDVGACREMIEGDSRENPSLGHGGIVVPLSSPVATADAIIQLMSDPQLLKRAGKNLQERVRRYYNKGDLQEKYRSLYNQYIDQ